MIKKTFVFFTLILFLLLVGCNFNTISDTKITGDSTTSTTSSTITTETADALAYSQLFDNTIYKKFVITFSRDNFLKLIDDMENYNDLYGSYRDNTIQEVDLYYEDGYGNQETYYEVGFRTKGNIFSRVLPVIKDEFGEIIGYQQVSFQLEFDATFDYLENSTEWKALQDREVFDLEQLNFKRINPQDSGVVTELVAYDLYKSAGIITSNTSLGVVYFQIEDELIAYGLYLIQEPIDSELIKRTFDTNQDGTIGDLYKCVWQGAQPATLKTNYLQDSLGVSDYNDGYRKSYQLKTNKETSNFSSFTTFVTKLNDTSAENYQNILESSLDIDSLLKAFAIGFLIGSPDDYRSDANNYYLYFYEGKAVYIPFDMDQSLGYGWDPYGNHGLDLDVLNYPYAQSYLGDINDLPLSTNILSFETYRNQYLNYLLEYANQETGIFQSSFYEAEFLMAKSLYEVELLNQNHLGVSYFSTTERWMSVSDYYQQKSSYAIERANFYLNP
ncbi:MAG: CotH kinase family protein [Firmicutes bacterium]|nr:CotH kinase family protein [Bacillota bacterium]